MDLMRLLAPAATFAEQVCPLAGVVLSLVGDIVINIGMNAMKHAHNINTDPDTQSPIKHFTKIPWWWIGILGIVGGEVGNLIAYGFAPAAIVTPIGSIGVVTNVIITTFVLKEPFTLKNLLGVVLVVIGIVVVVLFAPLTVVFVSSDNLWHDVIFTQNMGIYLAWMAVMLVILYPLSRKYGDKYVVIYVALCAVIASLTIVCAKTFSTLVNNGFQNGLETEFLSPWPYATLALMVVTCVVSMGYVNKAMMAFGNSQVVPIYFALFTTAGVGSAAWVYQEFQCFLDARQGVLFMVGIGVAILGVFFVSSGGCGTRVAPADDDGQVHPIDAGSLDTATRQNGGAERDKSRDDLKSSDGLSDTSVSGVAKAPSINGSGPMYGPCDASRSWPRGLGPAMPPGPGLDGSVGSLRVAPVLCLDVAKPIGTILLAPVSTQHYSPKSALISTSPQTEQTPSPTSKRRKEKQIKHGRCGLKQLKPLPPTVSAGPRANATLRDGTHVRGTVHSTQPDCSVTPRL